MAKEIKQRIVLEGEKEYNAAIKEAQRNLKVLRSELKAETAELGKNASEQDKNAAKVKSLQKQIAEQEKIVKTYEEALKKCREEYADNEDAIAKWEIKLNDAKASLANMKDGLNDVGEGFRQTAADANTGVTAAKSFADAFGSLSSIGESVSTAIEGIFSGLLSTITSAVGEVWQLVTETAAKANNWTDLANYFGSTAEQVQLMDRAISASAGDFGKFTNLVSQLSFGGKNDKITEWFGVSDANYTNNIDYTMAVLDAMSRAYKEWGTGGKWDSAMADIFGGKKSADVSWFVTNLDTILQKRNELQENGGYLMTEDELSTMSNVHVELNTIEEKWDMLKTKFAAGFGQVSLDIMTNVNGALDALAKYFDAETPEEREAALKELEENITAAFQRIADAIRAGIEVLGKVADELKESDDPVVKGLGNVLSGLVDALKWFTEDNANNVVKAFEIIAGFWLAGKGLAMATKIASVVSNIGVIRAFNAAGGAAGAGGAGAGAAGAGAAGAGSSGAGAAAGAAGSGGIFAKIGSAAGAGSSFSMAGGMGVFGSIAALAAAGYAGAKMIEANLNDENLNAVYGNNSGEGGIIDTMTEAQWEAAQKYFKLYNSGTDDAFDARDELYRMFEEGGIVNAEQAVSLLENAFENYENMMDPDGLIEKIIMNNPGFFGGDAGTMPADWWVNTSSWNRNGAGAPDENGVTTKDIEGLQNIPAGVESASERGVKKGISGLKVEIDGQTAGRILAPYVSAEIAKGID